MVERKSYSEGRIFDLSRQTGRSPPTLRRWARQGCDLDDPEALKKFLERMDSRKPPVDRRKNRNYSRVGNRPIQPQVPPERASRAPERSELHDNGEILPEGRKGAAAALMRLEAEEAQSYGRLRQALASGNQVEVEQCQLFWVRCVESLRKLDLSVELVRRSEESMISLREAESAVLATAEWLRVATIQFLGFETSSSMAIRNHGKFRAYFIERFRGNLELTVKAADKTCSALPSWAKRAVWEAWNVTPESLG